jgi:hypothetical protein
LVELRCDLTVEDGDLAASFLLTYLLPDGQPSGLTGPLMSGFGEDMLFDEEQLRGVAEAFLTDAADDIRREGLDLAYDDHAPPIRVVADAAAQQVIDARRRR